jgi:hypothetical protein
MRTSGAWQTAIAEVILKTGIYANRRINLSQFCPIGL